MATARGYKKESRQAIIGQVSPSLLIDPTFFVINFVERKFLSIGLDPADNFNVTARIIAPSSYLFTTPETLQRMFTMTRDILSRLMDAQLKTKTSECIVDDTVLFSKISRRGEIKLVFRSTFNDGKVSLSPEDLIALQHMERSAVDNILLKTKVIRPMVLRQLQRIAVYLKSNFSSSDTIEDKISVIRDVLHELIMSPDEEMCFASQLKLNADRQIAEKWMSLVRNGSNEVLKKIFLCDFIYKQFI